MINRLKGKTVLAVLFAVTLTLLISAASTYVHADTRNSSDQAINQEESSSDEDVIYDKNTDQSSEAGWVDDESGKRYQNADGSFIQNQWAEIDGSRYYFDSDGYMVVGWLSLEGGRYYLDESGKLAYGWQEIDKSFYYFYDDGKMAADTFVEGWKIYPDGKRINAGWRSNSTGWWYLDKDGTYPKDQSKVIDGSTYFFDGNGYMKTGWINYDSEWYYANVSGNLYHGWNSINGKRYYFDNEGVMAHDTIVDGWKLNHSGDRIDAGWKKNSTGWWYLRKDGTYPKNGRDTVNGSDYYFNNYGYMITGWILDGSTWYYANASGNLLQGWNRINGDDYYFYGDYKMAADTFVDGWKIYSNGKCVKAGWKHNNSGWWYLNKDGTYPAYVKEKINDYYYIFDSKGYMKNGGWITFNNDYYYSYNDGHIAISKWINNWYVNGDGIYIPSKWVNENGSWKYVYGDGTIPYSQWRLIDNTMYYFNSTGYICTGTANIGGKTFDFDYNGKLSPGWHEINGYWYYNNSDRTVATGWKKIGSDWYYFKSNGVMVTGYVKINGVTEQFTSSGKWVSAYSFIRSQLWRTNNLSSSTNWLIMVDTHANHTMIFYRGGSGWIPYYDWLCTTGAPSTPTIKGVFKTGVKGTSFGSGYTCWWYTGFYKSAYLFHSVIYQEGSMSTITDGRLGMNLSHGCIRLHISNAKWIYDNIPYGTTVYVY